jgi:ActR/RegA family two-component response regulator
MWRAMRSGSAASGREPSGSGGPPARLDLPPPRVLLVDTDPVARTTIAQALTEAGCEVIATLRTGIGATYACRTEHPTVAVIELDLRPAGTWSGLLLIPLLVKEGVRVLVATRPELAHLAGRVVAAGACQMLSKTDLSALISAVRDEHTAHVQAGSPQGGGPTPPPGRVAGSRPATASSHGFSATSRSGVPRR